MKLLWIFITVVVALIIVGYIYISSERNWGGGKMTVSSVFKNGGEIPKEFTCDGANVSPQLVINGIPRNARFLAIIVDDPDAPIGTFTHWTAWNIKVSSDSASIPKAVPRKTSLMIQGLNDFKRVGYDGPCPPRGHGKHHYHFRVFALDKELTLKDGSSRKELEKAMRGHIIAQAEVVGIYGR